MCEIYRIEIRYDNGVDYTIERKRWISDRSKSSAKGSYKGIMNIGYIVRERKDYRKRVHVRIQLNHIRAYK